MKIIMNIIYCFVLALSILHSSWGQYRRGGAGGGFVKVGPVAVGGFGARGRGGYYPPPPPNYYYPTTGYNPCYPYAYTYPCYYG